MNTVQYGAVRCGAVRCNTIQYDLFVNAGCMKAADADVDRPA